MIVFFVIIGRWFVLDGTGLQAEPPVLLKERGDSLPGILTAEICESYLQQILDARDETLRKFGQSFVKKEVMPLSQAGGFYQVHAERMGAHALWARKLDLAVVPVERELLIEREHQLFLEWNRSLVKLLKELAHARKFRQNERVRQLEAEFSSFIRKRTKIISGV